MHKTLTLAIAGTAGLASAGQSFDANVTGDVIFGSGNANGGFTVNQDNGLELGLRAKVRFDSNNQPQNIFNSNGDGTYTFRAGLPPSGFGFAPNSTSTATWNFEWSINSDFEGTSGDKLNAYTYVMKIDFDPSSGTNFLEFDPVNQVFADHAIGDNNTANGAGTNATDALEYASLINGNNIAQNSWNMEFFNDSGLGFPFDGRVAGEYDIVLEAFDAEGDLLVSNSITVFTVIPLPGASAMAGLGLIAVGTRRRR